MCPIGPQVLNSVSEVGRLEKCLTREGLPSSIDIKHCQIHRLTNQEVVERCKWVPS